MMGPVFIASCDKTVNCRDLALNQSIQVAAHDAPIKTCHWIKANTYSCLMTGLSDKTLRGPEYYNPAKKNSIFLRPCFEELKPKATP
ncbi:ribonucleic acid export 1 [Andrena cerasifolii]|uniref:ribonucleic acid export 1 n=1 Tax=Andrena cerasifolii TaxID=2819439 RepID=UPI0040381EF0